MPPARLQPVRQHLRKVAPALRALHLRWQPVFVDFMHGASRNGAWREAANQMGEVPMLEDRALRLMQSGLILTHLARVHGALGGNGQADRREMLRWIPFDNHKFTSYLANHRFMKAFAASAPDPAVMAWLRDRLDNAFGIADKHLEKLRKALSGLAEAAIAR